MFGVTPWVVFPQCDNTCIKYKGIQIKHKGIHITYKGILYR